MVRHAMKNIMAAALVVFIAAGAAYGAALQAKMTKVKGDVQMQKSGAGAWVKVKEGDVCGKGTKIKTGAGAEAFVSWGDGNSVKIKEMSQITLDNLMKDGAKSTSNVTLDKGKGFAKAGKLSGGSSFEVKTPTAVAGVRGTGFEFGESDISVVEGSVSMKVGGEEIIIEEGMMITVIEGEMGELEEIPASDLEDLQETLEEANEVIEDVAEALGELEDEGEGESAEDGELSEEEEGDESFDDVIDTIDSALEQDILGDITDAAESGGFEPGTGGIIGTIEY